MRKTGAVIALLSTGLLVLAVVTPVAASAGVASSESVTWRAPSWPREILKGVSSFHVQDGNPGLSGVYGTRASEGDSGSYTLTRYPKKGTAQTLTLDVKCVRVDASGWAEFAGVSTTPSTLPYVLGEVFLVSVKDGRLSDGAGDEIGMASHGTADNALNKGCYAALDEKQYLRQGVIRTGDIAVD